MRRSIAPDPVQRVRRRRGALAIGHAGRCLGSEKIRLSRGGAIPLIQPAAQLALATSLVEHRSRSAKREGTELSRRRASLLRLEQRARLVECAVQIWIPDD